MSQQETRWIKRVLHWLPAITVLLYNSCIDHSRSFAGSIQRIPPQSFEKLDNPADNRDRNECVVDCTVKTRRRQAHCSFRTWVPGDCNPSCPAGDDRIKILRFCSCTFSRTGILEGPGPLSLEAGLAEAQASWYCASSPLCPEPLFLSVIVLDNILVNVWTILMFPRRSKEAIHSIHCWGSGQRCLHPFCNPLQPVEGPSLHPLSP